MIPPEVAPQPGIDIFLYKFRYKDTFSDLIRYSAADRVILPQNFQPSKRVRYLGENSYLISRTLYHNDRNGTYADTRRNINQIIAIYYFIYTLMMLLKRLFFFPFSSPSPSPSSSPEFRRSYRASPKNTCLATI